MEKLQITGFALGKPRLSRSKKMEHMPFSTNMLQKTSAGMTFKFENLIFHDFYWEPLNPF